MDIFNNIWIINLINTPPTHDKIGYTTAGCSAPKSQPRTPKYIRIQHDDHVNE